jgi:FtsP/CotA-like multicopper oxidase with cupredoxin domain/peroxiredoxin
MKRVFVKPCGWLVTLLLILVSVARAQGPEDIRLRAAEDASVRLLKQKWESFFLRKAVRPPAVAPLAAIDEKFLPAPRRRDLALASTAAFQEPDSIASAGGVLNATLTVAYANNTIASDPVRLRSYNDKLVGPTLRAKAGDSLRIAVVNNLPPNPPGPGLNNTLHDWNTTNLHTHGLHVSPAGNSDNVFLSVLPGSRQDYRIDIPANHPAGVFWYHAHRHGAVAAQVSSGMAGAIVITGPLDAVPAVAAAKERVWILQQIPYFKDAGMAQGEIELTEAGELFGPGDWDTLGRFTTVNGVALPVITMRPGEVERWRLVDSGFRERIDLKIVAATGAATVPFHEIAIDGMPTGKVTSKISLELWPGYRSDVLVQAPTQVGDYLIIDERVPPGAGINGNGKDRRNIAKLVVAGNLNTMTLPTNADVAAFRPPSIPPASVTGAQSATFGINSDGSGGLAFQIDGRSFGSGFVRNLTLGKTEEWTLKSVNAVGPVTHPFHVHVNPVEVVSVTDNATGAPAADEPTPTWRDTLALKPGRTYKVRTTYADFLGDFVQHCHILDHEDQGMMEQISIQPATPPAGPAAAPQLLDEFRGRPVVVVMTLGLDCPACVDQLKQLSGQLRGTAVVGVTPKRVAAAAAEALPGVRVVADSDLVLYRKFGAFGNGPRHGVAVLDAQGKLLFQESGDHPFTDVVALQNAVAAAGLLGPPVPSCDCFPPTTLTRVRKNLDCLTQQELAVYKHAIQIVKDRSAVNPNDPTGYDWQVKIHGSPLVGPCQHNTELIWPWHRAMLFYFEETLRAADPDNPTLSTRNLTIPYWDWSKVPTGVGGYPAAYEDATSPLFHAGRNPYDAAHQPHLFTDADIGLDINDWGLFGGTKFGPGKLEMTPHNDGHGLYVDGDMSSTATSPKDPIFFSHHANLDRLWDLWQQKHGVNPLQQTVAMRGWGTTVTPAAIVSNFNDIRGQLHYDYCNPPATQVLDLPLPAGPSAALSLEAPLRHLRAEQPPRRSTAQVRLTGVSVPKDFSYTVRVYLHPAEVPFQPDNADFQAHYLADRFTVLANDASDHAGGIEVNLDVSRIYESLAGGAGAAGNLKVSFDFARIDKGKSAGVPWGTPGIEIRTARLVVNPSLLHGKK